MDKNALLAALDELREKQRKIDDAWNRLGDRSLLRFFVDILPVTLNAERSSLFILDPKQDRIWIKCGTGVDEAEITVPREGSLVGEVIETGISVIEDNMMDRTGTHESVGQQLGYTTRNAICVPVKNSANDRVIGAIQVLNKKDGKKFTAKDQEMLEKLAFQIQMNIEHIYLRQDLRKIGEALKNKIMQLESRVGKKRPTPR